jgi:hypothetical protein
MNRRPEMVVGWYHSHPGFGCWLSSVDINTQQVSLAGFEPTAPLYTQRIVSSALVSLRFESTLTPHPHSHSSSSTPDASLSSSTRSSLFAEKSSSTRSGLSTRNHLCRARRAGRRLATLGT